MGDITAARLEGTVRVRKGRKLGVAEFGTPDGQAVFWLHGTPGARRQIPEEARRIAAARGLRIIGIDRPGVGLSPPHLYDSVADFVPDLELVADQLGVERFSTIGLSGGAPYAMAAAVGLPDRVASVGVLGGVVPSVGPDAAPGGLVGFAHQFRALLPVVRVPAGYALQALVRMARPIGSQGLDLYARFSPPGDREVLRRPDIKAMFLDDLSDNGSRGLRSVLHDGILFTRPWGFTPTDISVPLTWWHGDADNIVPLAHAEHLVPRIPGATLHVRTGESHLGGLGIADEVLSSVVRW
ncbi:MAG: alpha/beta hydrolase [Acidimicrobiales bacterium]